MTKVTESTIKSKLLELLTQLKGFKFMAVLVLVFKKIESEDKTNYDSFYSSSKAEMIINESAFDDVFKSNYTTIITNIQKSLEKGLGRITDSVIHHNINISKYNSFSWKQLYKITKRIRPSKKRID